MKQWQKNLYTAWISQTLSLMGFGFVIPFIPYFIQELGVTNPDDIKFWTGFLSSIPSIGFALMAPVWGIIADKFGRKIMLLRAAGAAMIILLLMSISHNVEFVAILRLSQGLFTGTVTASATLVAAGTPKNKLAFALGILSSSTFIGFTLGPFIGGNLAELFGYRPTFVIGSFVMLISFFIVLFFIKEVKKESQNSEEPEKFSLVKIVSPILVLLFLILFQTRFIRVLPASFLPLMVQDIIGAQKGVAAITGNITAISCIFIALSSLTIVRLADRFDKFILIAIIIFFASLTSAPLYFSNGLLNFAIFYIASYFFIGALEPIIHSHISKLTPSANRGLVFGIINIIGGAGWAISPLLGSKIAIFFSIKSVFLFYSLSILFLLLILLIIIVFLRMKKIKNK